MKYFFKISLILLIFINSCKSDTPNCTIDISSIHFNQPVKIILYGSELTDKAKWKEIEVDSLITTKHQIIWPYKYNHSFIGNFAIRNAKNIIIGTSDQFIYSDDQLTVTEDKSSKPINITGQYENAISFNVKGGENELFKNRTFLQIPNFMRPKKSGISSLNQADDSIREVKFKNYESNTIKIVKQYNDKYYTLYRLVTLINIMNDSISEACYHSLDKKLQNTKEGIYIKTFLNNVRRMNLGKPLPSFNVMNGKNQIISFKNILVKKFYFIDFWASWCIGCRKQLQDFKSLYIPIDTTKLQFVSLSTDINKSVWLRAVEEERMKWPNYIQGNQNLFTVLGFSYIPQNLLINKRGIIIGRNLTKDDLADFLHKNNMLAKSSK